MLFITTTYKYYNYAVNILTITITYYHNDPFLLRHKVYNSESQNTYNNNKNTHAKKCFMYYYCQCV